MDRTAARQRRHQDGKEENANESQPGSSDRHRDRVRRVLDLRAYIYVFEHEQLREVRNATVHAFSSLSMEPAAGGYLACWAIYVRPVSRFTALYMTAIAPFRRFLVYPAIIRTVQGAWTER